MKQIKILCDQFLHDLDRHLEKLLRNADSESWETLLLCLCGPEALVLYKYLRRETNLIPEDSALFLTPREVFHRAYLTEESYKIGIKYLKWHHYVVEVEGWDESSPSRWIVRQPDEAERLQEMGRMSDKTQAKRGKRTAGYDGKEPSDAQKGA